MWSFPGPYANRGSETEQAFSDVSNHYTKDAAHIYQIGGSPVRTFDLERKKETADVELSRPLRKPGKRNGAGFF